MKINFNFDYDKLFLKEITILIPKYHNNLVSFLTPILGLYGINVKDFISDFESKTRFVNFDITIPVKVRITKIKTYEIFIKTPYIFTILNSLSLQKKSLNLLTIYKLVFLKSLVNNRLSVKHLYKNVYNRLRIYLLRSSLLGDSLVLKNSYSNNRLFGVINNPNLFFYKKLFENINNVKFLTNFSELNFGVFFSFHNHSSAIINKLFLIAKIFSVRILKIKPKLLSVFLNKNLNFSGDVFFFGSKKFSDFSNFTSSINFTLSSNFFRSFYRINNNIISISFFNNFLKSFSINKNRIISLLQVLRLRMIFLLNNKFLLLLKVINKINTNANLSSNIS
jgi:hypothetical protein